MESEKMEEGKNKRQSVAKESTVLRKTFYGRLLSQEFFKKYWRVLLGVLFLSILYISSRYYCVTRMEIINGLEKTREDISTRALYEKGKYMSNIREKNMQQLVDSLNLNLQVAKNPVYELKYEDYEEK